MRCTHSRGEEKTVSTNKACDLFATDLGFVFDGVANADNN